MEEKREFSDLTAEALEDICREIWKAKAAVNAAITAAAAQSADTDSLLLIAADYLTAADDHISAYI